MTAPASAVRAPLAMIVAMTDRRVIGKDNQLPWHLPEDLKRFRRLTTGHAVIMGRKTYESIGRPLPNRRNIVVSSDRSLRIPGCEVVPSVPAAIDLARTGDPEPFVIGGCRIFEAALPWTTTLHRTRVLDDIDGDTFFPPFDEGAWTVVSTEPGQGVVYETLVRYTPNP
jgi:dihydrofolate reductase